MKWGKVENLVDNLQAVPLEAKQIKHDIIQNQLGVSPLRLEIKHDISKSRFGLSPFGLKIKNDVSRRIQTQFRRQGPTLDSGQVPGGVGLVSRSYQRPRGLFVPLS